MKSSHGEYLNRSGACSANPGVETINYRHSRSQSYNYGNRPRQTDINNSNSAQNNSTNNINNESSINHNNPTNYSYQTNQRSVSYNRTGHSVRFKSPFTSNSFDSTSASNSASSTPIHCVTPARGMKTRKFISEQDIMGTPQKSGCNAKYNASGQLIPRRILIAVDGSENSEMAFDWYMNNLRDDKRDVLVLLHVSNSSHSMPIHSGVDIPQRSFDAFNEARRSSSSQIVTDVVELYEDKAREAGLNSSGYELIHMNDGNTAKTICKYAKNNNIDHVIMGTRGFSKIRRKLLGSVSDYVLNNCIVSTTVVRQPHEDK